MLEKPLLVHRSSPKVLLKIFTRDYPGNLYIPRNSRRKYTQPVNETPIWIICYMIWLYQCFYKYIFNQWSVGDLKFGAWLITKKKNTTKNGRPKKSIASSIAIPAAPWPKDVLQHQVQHNELASSVRNGPILRCKLVLFFHLFPTGAGFRKKAG